MQRISSITQTLRVAARCPVLVAGAVRRWTATPERAVTLVLFLALVTSGGVLALGGGSVTPGPSPSSEPLALVSTPTATPVPTPVPTPYSFHPVSPTPTFDWHVGDTPTPKPVGNGSGTCEVPPSRNPAAEAILLARVGRAEYNCGWWVVNYESAWNPADVNYSSGACGLPQAWPCAKMAPGWVIKLVPGGCPKHPGNLQYTCYATVSCTGVGCPGDLAGQINWFVSYVHSVYGNMMSAWMTELKQGFY